MGNGLIKRRKAVLMVLLALMVLITGMEGKLSVKAKNAGMENEGEMSDTSFGIDAILLAQDADLYSIQVNIKNFGKDWEGIVRVTAGEEYLLPCAYDTVLSLPEGSEKQFVVRISKGASNSIDGSVRITLLDEKNKVAATKELKRFLTEQMESIHLGILSDDYDALTYLDMNGEQLYYYDGHMSIRLVELSQDNLADTLNTLTILVIDDYNTEILTEEEQRAIGDWIKEGGVLIVGTGCYGQETLGGLEVVLPDASYMGIARDEDKAQALNTQWDIPAYLSEVTIAELDVGTAYYYNGFIPVKEEGDGAVGIVPYSLKEVSEKSSEGVLEQEIVEEVLECVCGAASARYNSNRIELNRYSIMGNMRRMMGILGNGSTELRFGVLKLFIVFYVIFVGPVLYLLLSVARKREWYWLCVPGVALLSIGIVFLTGRGIEVVHTKVYSVTTEDLTGREESKTCMLCYDADYGEWSLTLKEAYEYAGPLNNEYYDYSIDSDPSAFFYRIQQEGGKLSFGIKPSSAFENGYFIAGMKKGIKESEGTLRLEQEKGTGEVFYNDTDRDLMYCAVITSDTLRVYEGCCAGESFSLQEKAPIYNSQTDFEFTSDYIYSFTRQVKNGDIAADIAATSALGIGIIEAYPVRDADAVVVCGVTDDYVKAIEEKCSEISYGCLYVAN